LTLFDNSGRRRGARRGAIARHQEATIEIGEVSGCPAEGWFLLRQKPAGRGYYGTLRPQVMLLGPSWAACYHTQFHSDASCDGRRASAPLMTVGGKTRAAVSIINGSTREATATVALEGAGSPRSVEVRLAGRGATLMNIDEVFDGLPEQAGLVIRVRS